MNLFPFMGIKHPFPDPPEFGQSVEIIDGIIWMRLPLPMALDHVNVYAIDEGTHWALIDTGMDWSKGRAAWDELLRGPLSAKPITRVIVTHHHPDHVGRAGWFQEQGAALYMTRTAWLCARMLVLDEQPRPSREALQFYQRAGAPAEIIAKRAEERPFNFCDIVTKMPEGFHNLTEGQTLEIGGRNWTIRLGSGHAPDHASLWSENIILGGDQFLPSISANIGVYPSEPDANPLAEWLDACRKFQPLATNQHLVLPGHKLPFTGLPLRLVQMIENHEHALERLLKHISTPKRAHECFVPIFKRQIEGDQYGLALSEAVAHLNYLMHKGLCTRKVDAEGAYLWQRT